MNPRFRARTAHAAWFAALIVSGPAWAQAPVPEATPAALAAPPAATEAAEAATMGALRGELERIRSEFADVQRQYDARLFALESRLADLAARQEPLEATSGPTPPAATASPSAAPAVAPVQVGGTSPASQAFNPNISVNGNVVGIGGKNPFEEPPPLELTEVEAAFQAVVDPYARADFFLSAGPEGLEIEEGFVTFTALPASLLLKAGKLRASFGKVNTLHTHAMPTVDRPLVTEYLVGGSEGLSDSGVSLSHLIQNPYLFLEATGEVYAATSEVFSSTARSRLTYVGRLRGYRDLTEDMNLEVGTSFAVGPGEGLFASEDPAIAPDLHLGKRLAGIDATFRYRPLRRAIYRRLNLRSELVWSRQDIPGGSAAAAFGLYGLGEYQFARRWYAGARFDRSGRALDSASTDMGGAVFLTFWPTEFSQVRTQFRRLRFAEGTTANELLFQLNFSIGAHAAHAF